MAMEENRTKEEHMKDSFFCVWKIDNSLCLYLFLHRCGWMFFLIDKNKNKNKHIVDAKEIGDTV
jgi:hypothetical protein